MAYLPAEKIVMQANLFDTHEPAPAAPTQAMTTFYRTMRTLNLDVATIAPVHGRPVPMAAFIKAMGAGRQRLPRRRRRRLGGVETLPLTAYLRMCMCSGRAAVYP